MRIEELSNLSLAPVSYENWRGYINGTTPIQSYWADIGLILASGLYEDWRGYINGTTPIPSYCAHTGYILASGPYEDWRGYNRVNYVV